MEKQVTLLSNPSIPVIQRQRLATQIGVIQGNLHLQRVIARITEWKSLSPVKLHELRPVNSGQAVMRQPQPGTSGTTSTSEKNRSGQGEVRFKNVKSLEERPDFLLAKGESPTFDRTLKEAIRLGVRVAPDPKSSPTDLAQFDVLNNVIWIPKSEFDKTSHSSEFKRTIVHELEHALQNRSELEATKEPGARRRAIDQKALSLTEDEYVAMKWKNELKAERTSWVVHNESLNSFNKSRGQEGFPEEFLREIINIRLREFVEQNKADYERKFRQDYQRIVERNRPGSAPPEERKAK